MRLSLIQIARLQAMHETTMELMTEAVEESGILGLDTEHEISLAWAREYRALGEVFDSILRRRFIAEMAALQAAGAGTGDIDLARQEASERLIDFFSGLTFVLDALKATHQRAIMRSAAEAQVNTLISEVIGRSPPSDQSEQGP